jgi:hypothetical protein
MSKPDNTHWDFSLACDGLDFNQFAVNDPVPTGTQILEAANANEATSLFAILPNGDFEDVRLKETFDLRARGVETFVCFTTGVVYPFKINQRQLSWGLPSITGEQLYELAQPSESQAVFLDVPGGTDQQVEPDHVSDLTQPGVERFITAPRLIEIFVNSRSHYVRNPKVAYEQVVQFGFPNACDPNLIYTVSYSLAAAKPYSGDLSPDQHILVKQGTRFNVTPTVQS